MKKIKENSTIPFPPAQITDEPIKRRLMSYSINPDETRIMDDMKGEDVDDVPETPLTDEQKITMLLGKAVTLYKPEQIKVLKRNYTETSASYDVYFDKNHTILVIKPNEKSIGLVNREMDKDNFADVLEDIQEIKIEDPEERTLGKKLIAIGRDVIVPEVNIDEPEETIEDDTEEVSSELNQKMENNLENEVSDESGDLYLDDDPTKKEENTEQNKDENKKVINKEGLELNKGDFKMTTAKDISLKVGYKLLNDRKEIVSIADYLKENRIREFGSVFVKIKGNEYVDIYGMFGSKFDENKIVIPIVENGKIVFDKNSFSKEALLERFEVGERVRIDLSKVSGDYMKQIYGFAKRNGGFAIIESIENGEIKISENIKMAKTLGGFPINRDAVVKIETVKDACIIYEDKEIMDDYKKMLTENLKKTQEKKDEAEISEDIMNRTF